jgi:murein DD-endopeptidase MepM/ murein hydrolase activator NlpD
MAGALLGMFTITGMAGSYARMLLKVARFNELRTEKKALQTQYQQLQSVSHEKDVQVASLGSLANEVSLIYGLTPNPKLLAEADKPMPAEQVKYTIDQLYALRTSALTGTATTALGLGLTHQATLTEWARAAAAPTLWPVMGPITSSFGERIDPFNGEGAFHSGVDISCAYGQRVLAPADGTVTYADVHPGYGRMIEIDHGNGIVTRYGHLSGFAVADGQAIHRGQVIGYVGLSGRSTGPHLHYEVRINDTPVNPHKYLRATNDALGAGVASGT